MLVFEAVVASRWAGHEMSDHRPLIFNSFFNLGAIVSIRDEGGGIGLLKGREP